MTIPQPVLDDEGSHVLDRLLVVIGELVERSGGRWTLDEMKEVNDTQGHLAGDVLLRRAANVLLTTFRSSDIVARLGGDEFAVLAVDLDDGAATIEQRIRDAFAAAGISASVGVAVQAPDEHLRDVFHRADLTMYASKRES